MKIQNKDRYKVGSYCKRCDHITPEPSNIIWDLAVGIAPNPDIDRHPEIKFGSVYHDKRGWKHTILARLKILKFIRKKRVFCEKCGKQCRAVPLSKTDKRKAVEKERITIDKPIKILSQGIPVAKEVKRIKPDLPESLRLAKVHAKEYPDLFHVGRPKGRTERDRDEFLYEFNKIWNREWDHTIKPKLRVIFHLKKRGFTLSEERLASQFNEFGIHSFEDIVEYLNYLDDKKRERYIKTITKIILSILRDKEFNKILSDLGLKIDKNDILSGINLGEYDRRIEKIGPNGRFSYIFPLRDKEGNR